MLDAQCASNVDESALTTTLVLKASSTHWDKGVEGKVLRIEDVTHVSAASWHTAWVAVDDLHKTEVGVIQVHRKGDLLARSVLVDMVGLAASSGSRASKVTDKLTKCYVSNKRQAVHLTVLGED